jgi:hypothetical protein
MLRPKSVATQFTLHMILFVSRTTPLMMPRCRIVMPVWPLPFHSFDGYSIAYGHLGRPLRCFPFLPTKDPDPFVDKSPDSWWNLATPRSADNPVLRH